MEKNNRELLEKLKSLRSNPSSIHDLNDTELNNIFSVLNINENTGVENTQNQANTKGMMLTKNNPMYRGEETRENNNFSRYRIDGFAAPLILASITLLYGIIFMLIISNY